MASSAIPSSNPPSGIGFAHVKISLTVLASIADGAVAAPGLKTLAQTALEIVRIAERAKRNKDDVVAIADDTQKLMEILFGRLKGKTESDIGTELRADLNVLTKDLGGIRDLLKQHISRRQSLFKRLLHADNDAQYIMECKDTLARSIRRFQLKADINVQQKLNDI